MSSDVHSTTPPSKLSVWPIFLAGLLMIALFWGATELMRSWIATGSNIEAELAVTRTKNLQDLHASDQKELEGFSWVDKEKGTVRIPIQRAMELELAALNERKPQPGTLIDPEAAAAEAAAASASLAAPAVPAPAVPAPAASAPESTTPAPPAPSEEVAPAPSTPGAY
jgi:hypothetical protein